MGKVFRIWFEQSLIGGKRQEEQFQEKRNKEKMARIRA